jgi:hypothetical protein
MAFNREYPKDQSASILTYWNHPEGRLQVQFDQEDKELPFVISIACYPVPRAEELQPRNRSEGTSVYSVDSESAD